MENKAEILTVKGLFGKEDIRERFKEMLGTKAQGFITSVLQIVNSNDQLKKADPMSVFNAAATAATLDLPINNNLGFAYIIPYKTTTTNNEGKTIEIYLAQFQMGYKGFKQLALRTGEFKIMTATDVREGELKNHNRLTGEMDFTWNQDQKERVELPIEGYVSYFRLLNGFEHSFYMNKDEIEAHAKKYSQLYKKNSGMWITDRQGMAIKTVTKLNLSKNAPMSIQINRALITDQAIIKSIDKDTIDVEYIDNPIENEENKHEVSTDDKKEEMRKKGKDGKQGKIDMP